MRSVAYSSDLEQPWVGLAALWYYLCGAQLAFVGLLLNGIFQTNSKH